MIRHSQLLELVNKSEFEALLINFSCKEKKSILALKCCIRKERDKLVPEKLLFCVGKFATAVKYWFRLPVIGENRESKSLAVNSELIQQYLTPNLPIKAL